MSTQRITIYPTPHVELRVHVSDQMKKDFRECNRVAQDTKYEECKDCTKCSWYKSKIGNTIMCEFHEMERLLE